MRKIVLRPVFFIMLWLLIGLSSSCTKVINVDTNGADPQIVVQGSVPVGEKPVVKLAKSVNIDKNSDYPAVSNASVFITSNSGDIEMLTEISPGIYVGDSLIGVEGGSYTLNISADGQMLNSISTIPEKVRFDSLILNKTTGGGVRGASSESTYEVLVRYTDPSNKSNYYRFVEYVNGVESGDIYVFDDRLTNGLSVEAPLLKFNRKLHALDVFTVEMQCIDKNVYDYFSSFGNLSGGPQNSSTPANPYTNISGTKLGYFSAYSFEKRSVVIQ